MRRVRLGRCGAEVSALSFGTWPHSGPACVGDREVGWSGTDDVAAKRALIRAAEKGIDHWDTADVYGEGRAERLIGQVWDHVNRDQIFLASKVGWNPGPFGHFYHPEQMRARLEGSLTHMGVDHVDLYYLHHCDFGPSDEYLDDAISLMRKFRDEGKIRFIGLSDWSSEKVRQYIEKVDPDVVQPYRNVVDDEYHSSGLAGWVEEHDLGVAFFSPLRHGLLLGKYEAPTRFEKGDFRNGVEGFGDAETVAHMRRCRERVQQRFADREEAVLGALTGALLATAKGSCALLGLRNPDQVDAASRASEALAVEDAEWVARLYRGEDV